VGCGLERPKNKGRYHKVERAKEFREGAKMGWTEKTPRKLSFDVDVKKGETIEGVIASCTDAGSLGVKSYTMTTAGTKENPDGELISFLGNTVLDKVLPSEVGSLVRIQYLGKVGTASHFQVMQFKVSVYHIESNDENTAKAKADAESDAAAKAEAAKGKKK
jgi:hypothetical protein